MPATPPPQLGAEIRAALGETGAVGVTVRQLAARLDRQPERVAATLTDLARRGDVLRMGRGLYVLRAFERLDERKEFVDPVAFDERFERETGVEIGHVAGPITFRANEAAPVHRWWPYVQGYSAEFVRSVLDGFEMPRGATVLDPFAGSGTTLVEARRAGHRALGTELLAPAVLAARVKTTFALDGTRLVAAARRTVAAARRRRIGPLPFLRETRRQFDAARLGELTRLRDALAPEGTSAADALRLAFGKVLIPASRLHRSPCLGYDRRYRPLDATAYDLFLRAAETMRDDLTELQRERSTWGPPAEVRAEDARTAAWPRGSVDLAITSPPYVNGMDYVMNYKVDLAWLGYVRSYRDLAAIRRAEVACDNLPRSETAAYRSMNALPDPWLAGILEQIRTNVARKASYRRDDVHAVVHRYFADLVPVLRRVYEALRPGGRFVLVVGDSLLAGTYVPGDLLTARLGASVGFRIESVNVARSRRSGQRRSFLLRESVVTLERPRSAT
ncbi:MAG TPA: DNA methyltransferase [Thermoplasmata archaeon]|nr:DNA methyltransferase [Thermoplasmata archaeon]